MHRPDKENNDIYTLGRFPIKRTLTISATLLFLGFFFNFPISQIIKENVAKSISSLKIRGCPISYSKIEVEYFFFPKVILGFIFLLSEILSKAKPPGLVSW